MEEHHFVQDFDPVGEGTQGACQHNGSSRWPSGLPASTSSVLQLPFPPAHPSLSAQGLGW